jgi:uncharacterized protein YjbI with pentapeptide repeats
MRVWTPARLPLTALAIASASFSGTAATAQPVATRLKKDRSMAASQIAKMLRTGHAMILASVTVRGRLELTHVGTVRQPFKCRDCTFPRGLDAADVIFERTVDLSGSRIRGPADFGGATFEGPALFTAAPHPAEFARRVNFRLAVFEDLATFDQATFHKLARFNLTRFRGEASFASSTFANVTFSGAALGGGAIFDSTTFDSHADFERTTFGAVDFRGASFGSRAVFASATFGGAADYGDATFYRGAVFDEAQFGSGAAFVGTEFDGPVLVASFERAGAAGSLDFSFAQFKPDLEPTTDADADRDRQDQPLPALSFSELVSGGTVSFSSASFPPGFSIAMNRILAKNLVLGVADASRVDDAGDKKMLNRRHVLELIESSAKARDDLLVANDADYELHVIAARNYGLVHRIFDVVVYRWIAGYFVRPLRPLVTLVLLALVLAAARLFRHRAPPRPHARRRHRRFHGFGRRSFAVLVNEFLDALTRILPQRRTDESPTARLGHRIEAVTYRVLLACALIGLANSNPTLRQLVDAVL